MSDMLSSQNADLMDIVGEMSKEIKRVSGELAKHTAEAADKTHQIDEKLAKHEAGESEKAHQIDKLALKIADIAALEAKTADFDELTIQTVILPNQLPKSTPRFAMYQDMHDWLMLPHNPMRDEYQTHLKTFIGPVSAAFAAWPYGNTIGMWLSYMSYTGFDLPRISFPAYWNHSEHGKTTYSVGMKRGVPGRYLVFAAQGTSKNNWTHAIIHSSGQYRSTQRLAATPLYY